MEPIIESLKDLHQATVAPSALAVLQQLYEFLENLTDYSKIDQLIAALFPSEEDGVLAYLKGHLGIKEHDKGKREGLKILQLLVENPVFTRTVERFCLQIFKIVKTMYENQNETSAAQQDALDCVIVVIETFKDKIKIKSEEYEMQKFYFHLLVSSEKSSYTPSVRGKILQCLGLIASFGHDSFLSEEHQYMQLLNLYAYVLDMQVDSFNQKMEANMLLGCIKGLDKFLQSFCDKISTEQSVMKKIYKYLEIIVNPKCSIDNDGQTPKLKRREFQRAGLEFLAHHANYLREGLFEDHKYWYNILQVWAKSNNIDDSKVGTRAMMKFLDTVSAYARTIPGASDEVRSYNEFFADEFQNVLENPNKHKIELSVAIKGIGLLSDTSDDSRKMECLYNKLIEHMEAVIIELNMPVADKYSGSHSLVQTYLESAGRMLFAMKISNENDKNLFEKRILVVENLSILLITSYPDLSEKYRHFAPSAFLSVAHGLLKRHNKYGEPFVERVIQEGLTHIIASPTQVEADILVESYSQQNVASKKLGSGVKSVYNTLGLRTVKFYTQFWVGLTRNIETDVKISCEYIYNSVLDYCLKTIGKLDLSLEFVDDDENEENVTATDPISNSKATVVKDFQLFVNIVDFMWDFVLQAPAESFRNWIEPIVKETLGYIEIHPLVSGFYRLMALVFELTRKLEHFKVNCPVEVFQRCCGFLSSLSLKIQEFRDDLLLAILDVWLAAPDEIIINTNTSLGDTMQAVFGTGRNSFPLALRGILAIERWFQIPDFPEDEKARLFNQLFPLWQDYFTTGDIMEDEVAETSKDTKRKSRSKSKQQRLQTVVTTELQDTTLGKLQLQILRLIGSYGHLVDLDLEDERKGFSIHGQCLSYVIPFQDIKPDIFLDNFFPRLMELCIKSTDRQLRTSACEVLHTFVLYFVGQNNTSNKSDTRMNLCRSVFANMLLLGSDSDLVVRELFNPLSLQIIHWCSRSNHHFGGIILHLIIDGLVQNENPSRRDFCSTCLQEYFSWCRKHNNNPSAEKVIRFLVSLSQHAAPQYRQGSALGFNSIYRIFREPDQTQSKQLHDRYTFQLVHSYIVSLHLSAEFEESSLLVRTTKMALRHLERIVIKKKDNFCVAMNHRVIPTDVKGSTLRDLIDWLLEKSGTTTGNCREECFRLINIFVPCVRGISSVESFLNNFEEEFGRHSIIEIAESIFCAPDFDKDLIHRLKALESASDLYSFLKKSNYSVELLFSHDSSKFLHQVKRFFKDLQNIKNDSYEFTKVLPIVEDICSFENVLTAELQMFLLESSSRLSAQLVDKNIKILDLSETWKQLWNSFSSDQKIKGQLRLKSIFQLRLTEDQTDRVNRINWLADVAKNGFLKEIFTQKELIKIVQDCLDILDTLLFEKQRGDGSLKVKRISNRVKATSKAVFSFVVSLGINGDLIVQKIFDPTIVLQLKTSNKITKGDVYQKYFIGCLPFCTEALEFSKLKEEFSMERIGKLVQQLLVAVKNDKKLRKLFGELLVEKTIEIWNQISLNCSSIVISGLISGMASLHMKLCRDSEQLSDWWCGPGLLRDVNLSLKGKSEFIHFLGLFGLSKKKEIANKTISSLFETLQRDLNSELNWKNDEMVVLKIHHAILTVYEEIPRNIDMLKMIAFIVAKVSVLSKSERNGCSTVARRKLIRIANCLDHKDQLKMVDSLYRLVTGLSSEYRETQAVIKYLLLPILTSISERATKEFFKLNINDIASKTALEPKTIPEWHMKIIGFQLTEVLCLFVTSQGIYFTGAELNEVYLSRLGREAKPNDTKDCAKDLMRNCTAFTSPKSTTDENTRKLIFQCNQAAFNVMHAGLRVMQSKLSAVLAVGVELKMNKKNQEHWNNVIDCSLDYRFPAVLEQSETNRNKNESVLDEFSVITKLSSNSRSSRRAALQASSLALEATNYDYTAAVTVENSKFYQKIFAGIGSDSMKNRKTEVQLEWSLINEHPCMLSFVETIRNFDKKKSQTGNEEVVKELTVAIHDFIKSSKNHKNIKIFLVGAVLNCKDIFKTHAGLLVSSIVKAVLPPEACFGFEFNYFVKDVLVMLLEWTEVERPSSEEVTDVLKFILPIIWHVRKDVFNHNLQILQTIVTKWVGNDDNEMPVDIVCNLLDQTETKVGLEVCKHILLAGHFPCYLTPTPGKLDLKKLISLVAKTFESTSKLTYSLGAQVCGLTLREIKRAGGSGTLDTFSTFLRKFIDKEKNRPQVFLAILKQIQDFFPPFVTVYKVTAFQLISNKNLRCDALRMIPGILRTEVEECQSNPVKLAECFNNMYKDLVGRGALEITFKTDSEVQIAVDILEIFTDHFEDEEKLLRLIQWTELAEKSNNAVLRVQYASTVSKIYCKFQFNLRQDKSEFAKKAEKMFVRLYQDENENMQLIVGDFWERKLKSWMDSPKLLLELLEILADEPGAIPICISLIMKRCGLSPDYSQPIFKEGLGERDSDFIPFKIDTSWRMRHSTFQPLFAESLSSSQNFPNLPQTLKVAVMSQMQTTGKFGMNLLRATMDKLQFTPTVPGMQSNQSQESMEVGNSFSSQGFYQDFNELNNVDNSTDSASIVSGGPLAHLRKRFYERPPTQNNFYAIREIERQEAAAERKVEEIKTKRSGVKLMRTYRIGELPDIMMKNSDFLSAMVTMTKVDEQMRRSFLVHFFTAIMKKVAEKGSEPEETYQKAASLIFNSILEKYRAQISPELAAAIVEISVINHNVIPLKPQLITEVGMNFEKLQPVAILKLEKAFEYGDSSGSPQAKRAKLLRSGPNFEADILLRIAELYREIDDFDAVRNVFFMAGQASSAIEEKQIYEKGAQALYIQSLSKFEEALILYGNLCEAEAELAKEADNFNEMRFQFWESSVYNCLEQLSDWEEVFKRAESYCQDAGYEKIFDIFEYNDKILPHHLTSAVQVLVRDQSPADKEPDFVVSARQYFENVIDKQDVWENLVRECVDLSVLSAVLQHEVGLTLSWLDKSLNTSLDEFRYYSSLSKQQRSKQLLKLQRAAVLQDYLDWRKNVGYNDLEMSTCKVIAKWKHCGKPKDNCLMNTDIVFAEKDHFITSMAMCVEESMIESKDNLVKELQTTDFEQYLWLADLSISVGNANVAIQSFQKAKEISSSLGSSFKATREILRCQYLNTFNDSADWENMWESSWKSIRRLKHVDESVLNEIKIDLLKCLFKKLCDESPLMRGKISRALSIDSTTDLREHVGRLSMELAQVAADSAVNAHCPNSTAIHMKLYNMLKLIKSEMNKNPGGEDNAEIDKIMLVSLLQATHSGSSDALHLLPTTFPIIEQHPELAKILLEQVDKIPSWMYLPWLDQIVVNWTHSRSKLKDALKLIITRLIADYPQAFQLEYTNLLRSEKLPQVYSKYSEALFALAMPSQLFKEYFQPLRNAKAVEDAMEKCKKRFKEIREKPLIYGSVHQSYVNELAPKLENMLKKFKDAGSHSCSEGDSVGGTESEKDDSFAISLWNQLIIDVGKIKTSSNDGGQEVINLGNLSPWLASFRSCDYQDYLEVPGLYNKFEKPHIIFHPKIMSFHPTVVKMSSLTKPIRLTMICNNGKEVKFLVKKGDDLRQDKRIQQCLNVANEIFKVNPACKARKLQIKTYAVVPCTTDFGLIEWIDRTVSLKELILNTESLKTWFEEQHWQFNEWMEGSRKPIRRDFGKYHHNAKVVGRLLAEKKFDDIAQLLPSSLLRGHLQEGCNSLDNYFVVRERMIRSYATMCFVHWLLGIGDRHLENSLVSTESGEFLGIDFGRSFGIAVCRQPVPELIPFRLTPQVQDFLLPYGCNGLFKETMICVKRGVQKSEELLTSVADVFIQEPLADWLKIRSRGSDGSDSESDSSGWSSWDPIKILKSKLAGENPLTTMVDQIQFMSEKLRPIYTQVVKNGRGELGLKTQMTDEEYVDMLIALATDKNILIRHWVGWACWV